LVARYGDFVLYRPAVQPNTLVLWFAPGVLVAVGLLVLVAVIRHHRRSAVASRPLAAAEQQRLDDLLDSCEKEDRP
jgi:cytochrome c-type biogenesis protein CcmH